MPSERPLASRENVAERGGWRWPRIALRMVTTLAILSGAPARADFAPTTGPLPLEEVRFWAYQIQEIWAPGQVDALADSFYDMLVIEPTRTDVSETYTERFDTRAAVARLKNTAASDGRHRKLVIAYIDIGQAEEWRWYWTWSKGWSPPGPFPGDWPGFIVTADPDGWAGNYPVAYWDPAWRDIAIDGVALPPGPYRDYNSILDEVVKDGFDGIYLDWVEAFDDVDVVARATGDGVDPEAAMIDFIGRMRTFGRAVNPDFLVIQQNAPSLIDGHPELLDVIDAIAHEDTWHLGDGDVPWDDPRGYDTPQDLVYQAEVLNYLDQYLAGDRPVFIIDYTVTHAATVYPTARARGYVPYCSRTALSRLTTTPPPGLPLSPTRASRHYHLYP